MVDVLESKEALDLYLKIYEANFSDYFDKVNILYKSLKSKSVPISDGDLEYLITELPLELFTVSENLNALRLEVEVIKLNNRKVKYELENTISEELNSTDFSASYKRDAINRSVSYSMVEYEKILAIYQSVVSRVENELSFSRELIMGAKKVWDSRRSAEKSNPIGEPDVYLPDYNPDMKNKSYIK